MPDFYTTEKRTLGVVLSNTTPPLRVPDYQAILVGKNSRFQNFGMTSSASTSNILERT
jgi:hypothetical protein